MNTSVSYEEEFIEAEVGVIVSRFLVTGILWCIAVALLDKTSAPASDPYVANTRLGLWLFMAEVLYGLYHVRYTAPNSYPLLKRTAFVAAESLTQAWRMSVYVAINLVVRWIVVTLLTGLAISLFGNGILTRSAAILPSFACFTACLYSLSTMSMPAVIRGTHILSYAEAIARAASIVWNLEQALKQKFREGGFSEDDINEMKLVCYPFGGLRVPYLLLHAHYLFLGSTASGKTLNIRMLLKAVLRPFGELRHRSLIYDGKREYLPVLRGMQIPMQQIIIANPADVRCSAWNIAKDIRNHDDAVNLIAILVADEKGANEDPFFPPAVRALLVEVVMVLHFLSPGTWRLIDLVNAVRTKELLKRVLKTTKEGEEIFDRYFGDAPEQVAGIVATIDARFISTYETIARIWARCATSFSITQWLEDKSIILLGYDANRQAVDRINQAIFQRAAQMLCSLPEATEGPSSQTWIVLDEIRFTGKLPMLPELTSFGRTKNVHVVLGPQDLDGLITVYGEHAANELLALFGNVGILGLTSPKTREWSAKFMGEYEYIETEMSYSYTEGSSSGSGGSSTSQSSTWGTSKRRVKRESVLPSEFFNLPSTNRQNGMNGFYATREIGAWRACVPAIFLDEHLPLTDPDTSPFIPRSEYATDPVRWTKEDEERFTGKDKPDADSGDGKRPTPDEKKPPKGGKRPPTDNDKKDSEPLPEW